MSDTNLSDLLKKIEALRHNADRDESGMPQNTRPGLMVAKRQAQDEIDKLRVVYQKAIINKCHVFFVQDTVSAKQVQSVLDAASSIANTIAVESSGFYAPLAVSLNNSVGHHDRVYLPTHCASLSGLMLMKGREIGIFDMKNLGYKTNETIHNYSEALKLVRTLVRESNGDDANVTFTTNHILQEAENSQFTGDKLVVLLHGIPKDEIWAFRKRFPNNSVLDLAALGKVTTQTLTIALGLDPVATPEPVVVPKIELKTEIKKELKIEVKADKAKS